MNEPRIYTILLNFMNIFLQAFKTRFKQTFREQTKKISWCFLHREYCFQRTQINRPDQVTMKLSISYQNTLVIFIFQCLLCDSYSYQVNEYEPINYIDFDLLPEVNSTAQKQQPKYDVARDNYQKPSKLTKFQPLTRRPGKIEETYKNMLDWEKEPSCKELRRMWRMPRRSHFNALQTN